MLKENGKTKGNAVSSGLENQAAGGIVDGDRGEGEGVEMVAEFIRESRVRVLRYAEIPEFIPA